MEFEFDNLVRFLYMVVDYVKEIGFDGQFLIELKLKELIKYQYDFDAVYVYGFLKKYDFDKYFKFNIEVNYVILVGYDFYYELRFV